LCKDGLAAAERPSWNVSVALEEELTAALPSHDLTCCSLMVSHHFCISAAAAQVGFIAKILERYTACVSAPESVSLLYARVIRAKFVQKEAT
jgi:hypothetical protein